MQFRVAARVSLTRIPVVTIATVIALAVTGRITVLAQAPDVPADVAPKGSQVLYSPEVVAKADKIFADAGLKRSGKTIISLEAADLNRELGNLTKSRRTVKQLADARKATEEQLKWVADQLRTIDAQNAELNIRLVQAAGDVVANNRLVGLINANTSKLRQLDEQRTNLREKLAADRKALIDAESNYVDAVVTIRGKLTQLQSRLEEVLSANDLNVAIKVYQANFQTPASIDIAELISPIDRRLKQVEKEVFNETIQLDTDTSGAMFVKVTVGESTVPMVLDSGASMVVLPTETANKLSIVVPVGAPQLRLVLADGRTISASGVTIPKMRVGLFEVENVDAAILEPAAVGSEPLLGMTFLGNFKFEVDGPGKTLKLMRVGQ